MAQMGFFDLSDRYASLDAKKDPLAGDQLCLAMGRVPGFARAGLVPSRMKGGNPARGAKPIDAVLMFKTLVLSALYNLSDTRSSIRPVPGFPSCGASGWGSGTGCPTPRRSGSIARLWCQAGKVE